MFQSDTVKRAPRVIFFGMQSPFSIPSFMSLLEGQVEVCAVVLPASVPLPGTTAPAIVRKEPSRRFNALPMIGSDFQPSILQIAWEHQIPVWEVSRLGDTRTIEVLAAYHPDVICVACFSLLIPRSILQLPPLGCLNVHPSLLPANRGPVPLFWTFREGHETTGVTIHLMSDKVDAGDIVAQDVIAVPEGIRHAQLEQLCALRGGSLLAGSVWNLYYHRVKPLPQDEQNCSYHSFPRDEDFIVLPEEWRARCLYNFIRGVSDWEQPIEIRLDQGSLFVRDAASYIQENMTYPSKEVSIEENIVTVLCSDGQVIVHLAS